MYTGVKDFFYFPLIIFVDDNRRKVLGLNLAGQGIGVTRLQQGNMENWVYFYGGRELE